MIGRGRYPGIALLLLAGVVVSSAGQGGPTVWDGVYSEEQAGRGAVEYGNACASCHGNDLRGDSTSPSLVGVSFTFLWGGMPLGALFEKIRTQMPTGRPNSLPAETYRDILAYILEANEFPPGEEELATDSGLLQGILITATPPED